MTEPEDCAFCHGEAVEPDVVAAHERACDYAGHDILDEGGGKCTTCSVVLPPCPACGTRHGKAAPARPIDERFKEALRLIVGADPPEWARFECGGDLAIPMAEWALGTTELDEPWMTGIGFIDAAEAIVRCARAAGTVDDDGEVL